MKLFFKFIAWIFIFAGCILIAHLRVIGSDLTEGQLFFQYLHFWILAAGLILGGISILNDTESP